MLLIHNWTRVFVCSPLFHPFSSSSQKPYKWSKTRSGCSKIIAWSFHTYIVHIWHNMYWVFLVYIFLYFYFFAIKIYLTLNPLFPLQLNSFSLKFSKNFQSPVKKTKFSRPIGKKYIREGSKQGRRGRLPNEGTGFPKKDARFLKIKNIANLLSDDKEIK